MISSYLWITPEKRGKETLNPCEELKTSDSLQLFFLFSQLLSLCLQHWHVTHLITSMPGFLSRKTYTSSPLLPHPPPPPPPSTEHLDNSRLIRLLGANVRPVHEGAAASSWAKLYISLRSVLLSITQQWSQRGDTCASETESRWDVGMQM